jgi:hypothetical protein
VTQLQTHPLRSHNEPITLGIRKGLIFEVVQIWREYNSAQILPVNYDITLDYVVIAELDNLSKCGRAVEFLYGKRKK